MIRKIYKHNHYHHYLNNFGLSVIELIIALSLMGIILAIGYNFLFINYKAYQTGEALSEVQFDTRMASDYIFFELKNATKVSLTDTTLSNVIDLNNLKARYPRVSSINFSIVKSGNLYLVNYVIRASHTRLNNDYELKSEVLLNNINNATIGNGNIIYYSK